MTERNMMNPFQTTKNFSYSAFMHLGRFERHRSYIESLLQNCEKEVGDNDDFNKDAEFVAAIVMFRLNVCYPVRLKSYSILCTCETCHMGFCECCCHGDKAGVDYEDEDEDDRDDGTDDDDVSKEMNFIIKELMGIL